MKSVSKQRAFGRDQTRDARADDDEIVEFRFPFSDSSSDARASFPVDPFDVGVRVILSLRFQTANGQKIRRR